MDLLTLLNTASTQCGKGNTREGTPSSTQEESATPSSTTIPTPSPEPACPRPREVDSHDIAWEAEHTAQASKSDKTLLWNTAFSFPINAKLPLSTQFEMEQNTNSQNEDTQQGAQTRAGPLRPNPPSPLDTHPDDLLPAPIFRNQSSDYRGHRFSDSQSSFASLATSRSEAHSRISSVTTINEIPSIDSILSDVPRGDARSPGYFASSPTQYERQQKPAAGDASPRLRRKLTMAHSPRAMRSPRPASPSDVALGMNTQGKDMPSSATAPSYPHFKASSSRLIHPKTHKRAVSAPVIQPLPRNLPALPLPANRHVYTSQNSMASNGRPAMFHDECPAVLDNDREAARPAIMARHSDFAMNTAPALVGEGRFALSSTVSESVSESTLPQSPVDEEFTLDADMRMPSIEELELHGMEEKTISCIFVQGCKTNSPIRKSVSHFFGRNKGTTLLIPEHIWLVYCRQHYQRLRYRLGNSYPLHQLDLVKVVIRRIERWGQENKSRGAGNEVTGWKIILRKCVRDEQERWTSVKQKLASHGISQDEQDDIYETFKASRRHPGERGRNPSYPPLVGEHYPADTSTINAAETLTMIERNYPWLLEALGDDCSVDHLINVIDRLRDDYKVAMSATPPILKDLPPIEFLPNLTESSEERPIKTGRKRGSARSSRQPESAKRRVGSVSTTPESHVSGGHPGYLTTKQQVSYRSLPQPSAGDSFARIQEHPGSFWPGPSSHTVGQSRDTERATYIVPQVQPMHYHRSLSATGEHQSSGQPFSYAAPRTSEHNNLPTGMLPAPRPSHSRSISAFVPGNRSTVISDRPSSSGEGSHGRGAHGQNDYIPSSISQSQPRNAHIFGGFGSYYSMSHDGPMKFDFTPRTRPWTGWQDVESPNSSVPQRPGHWTTQEDSRESYWRPERAYAGGPPYGREPRK